ncbi:MAG: ABC transporter substrate-binding protein [Pseudorhodobacter sp.]|nr:ABC transporter substrate-binding protein [Pseudorhodobacter sp.]
MRLLFALLLVAAPSLADEVRIGHLSLKQDPRYVQDWGYARLITPPPVVTADAARMAVSDLQFTTEAVGLTVTLDAQAANAADLVATAQAMVAGGDSYLVLDLPGAQVKQVADALQGQPVLMVNATAPDDSLRTACYPDMVHSGPSDRQQMDAMAQYLRAMNWEKVLLLTGDQPEDAQLADAFALSAERLRISVEDRRAFTLAADPENREGNNIRLLTGDVDYDLVFVADTRGEFGRYIPYATQLPRPVIGSVGLTAGSWHWAYERDGATQVSSRFDKLTGRKMQPEDWDVWIGVKSLVTAALKVPQADPVKMREFLTSGDLKLDGSKGVTLNYRAWDGQMRQPILLGTEDAVIAVAPVAGFTHQTNDLDTLGTDEAEFHCS